MEEANKRALLAHAVPYGAWWALKFALDVPAIPAAWQYAIRSVICLVVFLVFRPWQWYPRLRLRHVPLGIGVGIFIFFVWVGPESASFKSFSPTFHSLYQRFCIGIFWATREVVTPPPYAPSTCGWTLALARLAGSSFVIAFIEEFFFRGFLYRFAIGGIEKFSKIDPGTVDPIMFMLVAATFAFEHNEWLAGLVCGLAYGWLFVQSRDIWAAGIAHMTTNFLLSIYVLWTGAHQFW